LAFDVIEAEDGGVEDGKDFRFFEMLKEQMIDLL
jgi:hypothetical protein